MSVTPAHYLDATTTADPSPAISNGETMNDHTCTCCEQLAELRHNLDGLAQAITVAAQPPPTQES